MHFEFYDIYNLVLITKQLKKVQLIENMVILHMELNGIAKAVTCKYFGHRFPCRGPCGQKSTCSEHGRVAYQIKWTHKCSSTLANILSADPQGHVAYQIKGNGASSTM